MNGLLMKEILLLKKNKVWFIIIIALLGLFGIFIPTISLFIPLFLPTAVCGSVNNDEKSKWTVYSQSLPFERKDYVSVKYISAFIVALAGVAIFVISYLISSLLDFSLYNTKLLVYLCAVSLGISLVPVSVCMPFGYGFNSMIGGIAYGIAYFGVMICFPMICMSSILGEMLNFYPAVSTSLIAMAVIIAVFLLSWFIAIKIYEKRDL